MVPPFVVVVPLHSPVVNPVGSPTTNRPGMANRFAPLQLPANLHDLPQGYAQRIKLFNGERGYSAEEHRGWFEDWANLEEIDHDDVKMRVFAQSLAGEARKWFTALPNASIADFPVFEVLFKNKWEERRIPVISCPNITQ